MPRPRSEPLSPSEWKVMKIVWQLKSCAARDVYEEARELHDWSPSTTKTILRRLAEKGYVTTTRVGNSFLYRPARSALRSLYGAADILLDHALEGTTGPLLAYMVKKSELSEHEIEELQALLDEHRSNREE